MKQLDRIEKALEYIDAHLDESIPLEQISGAFHFSPYYFHRMFSAVAGRPVTAYIRDRRLQKACRMLAQTHDAILSISLECGFDTAQSFSRAFKSRYGISPSQFRKAPKTIEQPTVRELMEGFRRRLKGGIAVEPRIIQRPVLHIAGTGGDGTRTAEVWQSFMDLQEKNPPREALSQDGYEVRTYSEGSQWCHVGLSVKSSREQVPYSLLSLPLALYAAFDVYVAEGYDSQNTAMDEWLCANRDKYAQRRLEGKEYVVEYYDERFHGDAAGSIVEIWVPIEEA